MMKSSVEKFANVSWVNLNLNKISSSLSTSCNGKHRKSLMIFLLL